MKNNGCITVCSPTKDSLQLPFLEEMLLNFFFFLIVFLVPLSEINKMYFWSPSFWKTHSCKLIPNWTRNRMITYTNSVQRIIVPLLDLRMYIIVQELLISVLEKHEYYVFLVWAFLRILKLRHCVFYSSISENYTWFGNYSQASSKTKTWTVGNSHGLFSELKIYTYMQELCRVS